MNLLAVLVGVGTDLLAELEAPQAGIEEAGMSRRSDDVDVLGVEQEQGDLSIPFEGAARAALSEARAPCILLPADRGVLEPSDDLTLREIRGFDPRRGCLSRSRRRFAPLAAHLALAALAKRSEEARSVERMWKVLSKYFPELPRPVPSPDGRPSRLSVVSPVISRRRRGRRTPFSSSP
jgi:hypothetical protein